MSTRRVRIQSEAGLHARPAGALAAVAAAQPVAITVSKVVDGAPGEIVQAASVLALLTLAVQRGEEIELAADGPEADAALDAVIGALDHDLAPVA